MGKHIEKIVIVLVVSITHSNSIDISSHSNDKLIKEGQSYFLYCSTNEPYKTCMLGKDGIKFCHTVDSNDIDKLNGTTCSNNARFVMILDPNLCGVRIDNVTAADLRLC